MYSVKQIDRALESAVVHIESNKEKYVRNPKSDFTRDRKFPMKEVINQIISMNGGSLERELYKSSKARGIKVTSSAFIQQRSKIFGTAFKDVFQEFNRLCPDHKKYKGYRLLAVDGTDINIAHNPESNTYIKPNKTKSGKLAKGYNQYHLNAIYDIMNKVYVDAYIQPKPMADERLALIEMFENKEYDTRTLFMADRGYPSWNIFTHFKYKNNAEYLFRVKNEGNSLVKNLPLSEFDIDKKITVTTNQSLFGKNAYVVIPKRKRTQKNRTYKVNPKKSPAQWDYGDFEELSFRIVRFKISDTTYETIFTSLPRNKFSIKEIKNLYALRWGIETSFRDLKYSIGLTHLHCKREDFVVQEIYGALTMYNYCSRISASAPINQKNKCRYGYKVNFSMAVYICKNYYHSIKKNFKILINDISNYIEPVRPGRQDVRNISPTSFVGFTYRVAS